MVDTPLGRVGVRWRGDVVISVSLDPDAVMKSARRSASPPDPVQALAPATVTSPPDWLVQQIQTYCRQPDFSFSLTTSPAGTGFQRRVWRLIAAIPAGSTRTYSELAAELGSSPRAVGGACRANPYPLLVPCHRVVAVNGLGGFAGDTGGRLLAFKRRLLAHEGVISA